MALGTAHIHLLDAKLFSDYSHPIEFSEFGRATIAEEVFERADPEMKEISRQSKTESPARWLFVLCWMHITLIVLRCMQIPSLWSVLKIWGDGKRNRYASGRGAIS